MPRPPRRPNHPQRGKTGPAKPASNAGWDPVAAWYDKLVGESGMDYHKHVILPAALRLLAPKPGESVIDVCCGQGVLAPFLFEAKISTYLGIDASPQLIASARKRHGAQRGASFLAADACATGSEWADGSHDAAACLMAVHDVPDAVALFRNLRLSLKPGGRAVIVMMHPCFRIPRQSHWGWDNEQVIQFRRIDQYLSPLDIGITTHPGNRAESTQTIFHHRPIGEVLTALGSSGLVLDSCEELTSHRRSQPGKFSKAEHRAAQEIPLFLAIKAHAL